MTLKIITSVGAAAATIKITIKMPSAARTIAAGNAIVGEGRY